ncbi:hypothetical protein BKA61DRAFT_613384 [Leptodontidium sp. MPI-SDFR-AT-0119]|nr:hypothetical protein BKA61DRAFT_613384 [Leptodontidium sp. MPI-SDFR-AT-0119]
MPAQAVGCEIPPARSISIALNIRLRNQVVGGSWSSYRRPWCVYFHFPTTVESISGPFFRLEMTATMVPWSISRRRLTPILFVVVVVLLTAIFSLYKWPPNSSVRDYLPEWKHVSLGNFNNNTDSDDQPDLKNEEEERLGLDSLPEYNLQPFDTPFCQDRYGRKYLENLHDSSTGYCTPNSQTNMTCFHSKTAASDPRVDMFCLGKSAVYDPADKKFKLGCEQRTLTASETDRGIPGLSSLSSYWYGTGPKVLYDSAVQLHNNVEGSSPTPNFTILLKREGAWNPWHCLMEIWSLIMSLDVLRTTSDPDTGKPFFTVEDAENTQILILDDQDDGPYYEMWTMFAKKPIIRIADYPAEKKVENIILPLAGASNPLWQGDWEAHPCEKSELLHTFTHRILNFYKIDVWAPHQGDLVLTYIDRKESRRLIDAELYLEELKTVIPHLKTQSIDFAAMTFGEQLKIVRDTDILVGVHGAGLTHGMFLREGSVMVELLPDTLNYKGFRNLAGLVGDTYLSAHADARLAEEGKNRQDWHKEDIYVGKEKFIEVMKVAVKTLYNKGYRSFDIV